MARKESDKAPNEPADTIDSAGIGYFARTGRPVYALVFLLPFILLYEILVLAVNPQLLSEPVNNVRGGVVAFVWIQNLLHYIGLDAKNAWLCAPLVIIITLLTLQLTSRQKWKILWPDFLIMTCECILISLPLIILSLILNRPARPPQTACLLAAAGLHCHGVVIDVITGIGAGIYEELIFRLVLIGLLMLFFETILGIKRSKAIIISVVISAVLFSLHHHFVFLFGRYAKLEVLAPAPFIFRTAAGIYFASIFAVRGFGVVAGAHIFYNIIATILNTCLFNNG